MAEEYFKNTSTDQKDPPEPSFIERAGLRKNKQIFLTVFLICGLLNYIGMAGFHWPALEGKEDILLILMLIGISGTLIDIIWFSWFTRCPACDRRVFTFFLTIKGEMPIGEDNNKCPFCGFPKETIHITAETQNAPPPKEKLNFISKIGLIVLAGFIFGIFYIGIPDLTVRGILAPFLAGIAFVIPFFIIHHYYHAPKGLKLFLVIISSCILASMIFLFISRIIDLNFYSISISILIFTVMTIIAFMVETQSNIFK